MFIARDLLSRIPDNYPDLHKMDAIKVNNDDDDDTIGGGDDDDDEDMGPIV